MFILVDLLVVGLLYMAYPNGCRHKLTFLPRLKPWLFHVFMPMLLAAHISQDGPFPEHVGILMGLSITPVLVFVASSCAQ